jgi:glyoxylase-like metal-dependent hydrolase (beta-lactamase superfamily II)
MKIVNEVTVEMSHSPASGAAASAVTAEGEALTSDPRLLKYIGIPAPPAGACAEVASGVRWARIPLPLDLDHINVWLLDADDGCVVVDTGIAASIGMDAWEIVEREVFASKPLRGLFITHIHPDHIGLAAWLQERHRVPVWMSEPTWKMATLMLRGIDQIRYEQAEHFFRSHGVTEPAQIQAMFRPERYAKMVSGMPNVERLVADGEKLRWGASEWTVLQTDGHAEGHLCLFDAEQRVLITGDQVLPTISPNIGLSWLAHDPNPLGSYLASLEQLRGLPEDTLVLPSHGLPFRGLRQRIDDLRNHHEQKLATLVRACAEPKAAVDVLSMLFRRELKGMHLFLALSEALAHLEYLAHAGCVERVTSNGTIRYQAK